jgi:hypothetical protein
MVVTVRIGKDGSGTLTYVPDTGIVITTGVSCRVRTLANGQRGRAVKEVRRTIPMGLPYDPIQFPEGHWEIIGVEWRDTYGFDEWEYGNVKIRTNARAMVETWLLDNDGNYLKPTGNRVVDSGYLIHYSESSTTLGCLRADSQDDINAVAGYIELRLKQGECVYLDVSYA